MRFEIDPTTKQARFDIDPSDDILKEAEAATVLKTEYHGQQVEYFYPGQPVIGKLASKISLGILGDYAKERMFGREPSLDSLERSLRAKLPILLEASIHDRIESIKQLYPAEKVLSKKGLLARLWG